MKEPLCLCSIRSCHHHHQLAKALPYQVPQGCTGHFLFGRPPMLNSIVRKNYFDLVWCKTSSKQQYHADSTKMRRSHTLKLSSACEVTMSLQFLIWPTNNKKSQTVTKTGQAWHELDSVSPCSLLCCGFASLRAYSVSEHTA